MRIGSHPVRRTAPAAQGFIVAPARGLWHASLVTRLRQRKRSTGLAFVLWVLAVAIAPDCSSLVAAGNAYVTSAGIFDPLLIRLTEAGQIDEAFSAAANGSLRWLVKEGTSASPTGVAIDAQGRYLVGMNIFPSGRPLWAGARVSSRRGRGRRRRRP